MTGPQGRAGQPMGDELTNVLLIAIGGLLGVAFVLRAAGSVAAFLTGTAQPTAGATGGVAVFFHPADPGGQLGADGLSPVVYWITAALMLTALTAAGLWAWSLIRRTMRQAAGDPHRQEGTATGHEVAKAASAKALMRRAGTLRPSLENPGPGDVGYRLGTAHRREVWASVEDSILLIGPPRSGKGLHLIIPAILDAPGAVVTTSTRPDNVTACLRARRRVGPVAVFDPQRLAEGLPAGMRWSPIRGCESPQTAMIRAAGLASATGLSAGGVEGGDFWEGKTKAALQALLHAAALDRRSPSELFRWTLDPTSAADAVAILTNHAQAATGWADSLASMIDADPRTRDSIWQGVSLSLAALADPRVLDAVSPAEGEEFDPEAFIRERGTLFLLATGAGAGKSAAIILGGASNSRDLQDLSTLIGERDELTDTTTVGDYGSRSNQRSVRRVAILPPDHIRRLPFGTAVTLLRSAPPIITDLRAWPDRPDGKQLQSDRAEVEQLLHDAHGQ
ncbi:type IV secretory pathway TraG/TraD family ATPase VirD4 [Streptomonospora nanhaiensis]|uniref:Type IV secretory pathway TraG/TraD family ATPase VirD4 n=1 Tax=Streptomonospora nanhaiensis TaxID=1323731 RepID=A0A853BVJ8_9ACTN|nr:type IV secretory pathway TraG/TraD family ATPase VirD4 [Streptomonospora nanhaiensis]